jgi:preprotein translocase subunit SecY
MFDTVKNAFKVKEIRSKLLFTLLCLLIVRIGCAFPVPGIDRDYFQVWLAQKEGLGFIDTLTGGSFSQMSIFALNISPYITSSIIVQLLTIVFPKLEELQKDGETGRKKIAEISRYLTIGLAVVESIALIIGFGNSGILEGGLTFWNATVITASFTAGSAFLMWLGERITEKGVSNGISMILLVNIVASLPNDFSNLVKKFVIAPTAVVNKVLGVVGIAAVVLVLVVLVILLQDAQRKIPVQYAKKVQGRKMVGGQGSFIPLKVNTAGVIPIIFASSLMSFPQIIIAFVGKTPGGFWGKIIKMLSSSNWFNPADWLSTVGLILYIVLVVFFAYFYTSITFNPIEVADNMKKQGGFIPGIRPGKATENYLNSVLKYIIFIGAVGLVIVCVIPYIFNGLFHANVSFGGTSLIIIVSVILETLKQIESMMLVRNYKGFLTE